MAYEVQDFLHPLVYLECFDAFGLVWQEAPSRSEQKALNELTS